MATSPIPTAWFLTLVKKSWRNMIINIIIIIIMITYSGTTQQRTTVLSSIGKEIVKNNTGVLYIYIVCKKKIGFWDRVE